MFRKLLTYFFLVLVVGLITIPRSVQAICARVEMQIPQEMTFERMAFDARLSIANQMPEVTLEKVRVDVTIVDEEGNACEELFFMRISDIKEITSVEGTDSIGANKTAEIHWLIIPSPGAGGEEPRGRIYYVGAHLSYVIDGVEEIMPIVPDMITVQPMPILELDYFMPYHVLGDDPMTAKVEPAVPYSLGVRVNNVGYGDALNLKIDSAQPKITSNEMGLLIDFRIVDSTVNGEPSEPTLGVNFGTLKGQGCSVAAWRMISTLAGRFIEFTAEYTHATELGGELTSLIQDVSTHYLVHEVLANVTGCDTIPDFLADSDRDDEHLPDTIFDSQGRDFPVNVAEGTTGDDRPTSARPFVTLELKDAPTNWVYCQVPDPAQGLIPLEKAERADGILIDSHNVWISEVRDKGDVSYYLNILDFLREDTPTTYTVYYTPPEEDTTPPVTTLLVGEPSYTTQSLIYVTYDTPIIFNAEDDLSGVDQTYYRLDEGEWESISLLRLSIPGEHQLLYKSIDRAGNEETYKVVNLFMDEDIPVIQSLAVIPESFTPGAPRGIDATRSAEIRMYVTESVPEGAVTIEVASGVGDFNKLFVNRVLEATVPSNTYASVTWDGKTNDGGIATPGTYQVRVTVDDQLGHTTYAVTSVEIKDYITATALSPDLSGDQMYPDIHGNLVVWQDNRTGNWDIYLKDLSDGTITVVGKGPGTQERPALFNDRIVWQDNTHGTYDINLYNVTTGSTSFIISGQGDQIRPAIGSDWLVWQDNRNGNWDIYAYNLNDKSIRQITHHERDQIHPVICGNTVVWEDYRHGLGEIYSYNLGTSVEKRITSNIDNQAWPAVLNNTVAWMDHRNGNQDTYLGDIIVGTENRLNFEKSDQFKPVFNGISEKVIFYTDYSAGPSDPNVVLFVVDSGFTLPISLNAARQEEPAAYDKRVVWQDSRDGVWQIYTAEVDIPESQMTYQIIKGFNNLVVTDALAQYNTAQGFMNAWNPELDIRKIMQYDPVFKHYQVVTYDPAEKTFRGDNFGLRKGFGLIVYANGEGQINLGQRSIIVSLTLEQGFNNVGTLGWPSGFSAYDFINSVGPDKVISVQQMDKDTGLWKSAVVVEGAPVGDDFLLVPGEGLFVEMKERVFGWSP